MNKSESVATQNVNQLIVDKLQVYPSKISELAIKAIQLAETNSERNIIEYLHSYIRQMIRRNGDTL